MPRAAQNSLVSLIRFSNWGWLFVFSMGIVAWGLNTSDLFGFSGAIQVPEGEPKIVERFEGVEPSWSVRSASQNLIIHKHFRTKEERRTGSQSEFFQFKTVGRNPASLIHSIKAAQVINDFCPMVWVRSNQDSIKFSARLVLPKTQNPVGQGPLKLLVELDQSETTGQWEQLGCVPGDVKRKLNGRLRGVQFQFKDLNIDTTDAYCDLVVLSGFDRPATEYQVWIDDLSHTGFLPARLATSDIPAETLDERSDHEVVVRDSRFRVNDKPFFLRAVEHNGESLAFLKQLGFNGVVLNRPPTSAELEQAQQYQVWIICPPLMSERVSTANLLTDSNLEMIFGWDLGSGLTFHDLPRTRGLLSQVKSMEKLLDRPTFCQAHFPQNQYSGLVDFQRLSQLTFGTSFTIKNFREYLLRANPGSKPCIVDVQTSLPEKILSQSQLLPSPQGNGLLSRKQVLRLTFEALYSGARGIVFQSDANLQSDKERAPWLVPLLRSINRELIQIDPWIAGGTAKKLTTKQGSAIQFELPRSQLTVTFNRARDKPVRKRGHTLQVACALQAPRVYKLNENGVIPVLHQTRNGEVSLELSMQAGWERFVISEDTLSFKYVQQATQSFSNDGGLLRDKYEILLNSFERLQRMVESLSREEVNSPALYVSIAEVEKSLNMISTFLDRKQVATVQSMLPNAENRLDWVIQSLQQELTASREMVNSSFNSDFGQLVNYISIEKKLKNRSWSGNLFDGGMFDSVQTMSEAGWSQHLNSSSQVRSQVSLCSNQDRNIEAVSAPQTRRLSAHCLEIQTWAPSGFDEMVSVTPVWVSSPTVSVKSRQVIRIDGFVKIDSPVGNSLDGFMIIDSIGGAELGSRFKSTKGWQYFAIERVVPRDMQFQIILAQTGIGKVHLSNIQARTCDLDESNLTLKKESTSAIANTGSGTTDKRIGSIPNQENRIR